MPLGSPMPVPLTRHFNTFSLSSEVSCLHPTLKMPGPQREPGVRPGPRGVQMTKARPGPRGLLLPQQDDDFFEGKHLES